MPAPIPGRSATARGNTEPTVTDANVVLQTLNPTHLLGGRMAVRQDLARAAIERLASTLGLDTMATAQGIISVVTANMARAIRVISVQRGHDPRDYTLVAFGGAGPLHAARLAKELEIGRILVPRNPGILCAMGLLLTDLRADFATTRLHTLSTAALPDIADAFRALRAQADAWFDEEGIAPEARRIMRTVDMRYAGQNYELAVPLPDGAIGPATLDAWRRVSPPRISGMYGFAAEDEPVQLVTFRVEAAGRRAEGAVPAASRCRARRLRRDHGAARGLAAGGRRLRALPGLRPRPAATPATASPARRSSSRWTPPPSSCRA